MTGLAGAYPWVGQSPVPVNAFIKREAVSMDRQGAKKAN